MNRLKKITLSILCMACIYVLFGTIDVNATEQIKITQDLEDSKVEENAPIELKVEAEGGAGTLSYTWQYHYAGKSTWTNWGEGPTKSFQAWKGWDGLVYRCIVKDEAGVTAITREGKLIINSGTCIRIVKDLEDSKVEENAPIELKVEAEGGTGTFSYTWQYHYAGKSTWTNWGEGQTKSFKAWKSWDGLAYRCIVKDEAGVTAITREGKVIITPSASIKIVKDLEDSEVEENAPIELKVEAEGGTGTLSYTWQYHYAGKSNWTNWGEGPSKSFQAWKGWNGLVYRCIVKDETGATAITQEGKLIISPCIRITQDLEDSRVEENAPIELKVEAEGGTGALSYIWQYHYAGKSNWTNWGEGPIKSFKAWKSWDGLVYRCIVKDEAGAAVITREGKVIITPSASIKFVKDLEDCKVEENAPIELKVEAEGGTGTLSYTWQYHYAGKTYWSNWGEGPIKTFKAWKSWEGLTYRCIIKDENGSTAVSKEGKLIIESVPSIQVEYSGDLTENGENSVGAGVSFVLKAESSNAEAVQWQISSNGSDFSDLSGETGTELAYTNSPAPLESQTVYFRAVATSSTGNTAVSNVIEVLLLSEDELPIRPQSNSVESKVAENPESETVSETQAAGTGAADSETADKVEDKSVSGVENNDTGLAKDFTSENNTETQTEKETGSEPEAESETQDMTADVSEEAQ